MDKAAIRTALENQRIEQQWIVDRKNAELSQIADALSGLRSAYSEIERASTTYRQVIEGDIFLLNNSAWMATRRIRFLEEHVTNNKRALAYYMGEIVSLCETLEAEERRLRTDIDNAYITIASINSNLAAL